jgi:hypothetical protein
VALLPRSVGDVVLAVASKSKSNCLPAANTIALPHSPPEQ